MHTILSYFSQIGAVLAQPTRLAAQVFNGPGLTGGVSQAGAVRGPVKGTLRDVILQLLYKVLGFLSLAAVVVIIGAGIYLVVGFGSEDSKTKAKNIIIYTIFGLLIVYFARSIVGFINNGIF
jgi:hypothetical protein